MLTDAEAPSPGFCTTIYVFPYVAWIASQAGGCWCTVIHGLYTNRASLAQARPAAVPLRRLLAEEEGAGRPRPLGSAESCAG